MIHKHLLRPDRLRQVPPSFSWVDHRLVRDRHIQACDCRALALYLFLVTVSDVQGLSYYSDAAIGRYLKLPAEELHDARTQLRQADLIAYHKPLYQVLSVPESTGSLPEASGPRTGQPQSVADILRRALQGGTHD